MKNDILKISNLSKTFHEGADYKVRVLRDLDLEIKEEEFVSVVGSNGTGKSTLFRIISGQTEPSLGNIFLNNENIINLKEYEISKYISQVKQKPDENLILSLTLFENLCLAKLRSEKAKMITPKQELKKELFHILKSFNLGLEKRLDDLVSSFSGGQKQTVALLMATINNPKILLLDEHTASLDPVNSERVIELTKKIVSEKKITTLMITHNITHAIEVGDRLLILSGGKIKLDISGEEKRKLTIEKIVKELHHEHLELEEDM